MSRLMIAARILTLAAWHAAAGLAIAGAPTASAAELFAGGYSFSDELGGFRLVSASGRGTADDPVVLVEELPSVDPVILVIRRHGVGAGQVQLTLVKQVFNRSKRIWAGFEVELQEILHEPSVYSDGLSFKQFSIQDTDIESDTFTLNERRYEPYDRIAFQGGSVDPEASARFRLTITDPTPVDEFYLLQDPNLLSAGLPVTGRSFAANGK
jgi:hypothetical protein